MVSKPLDPSPLFKLGKEQTDAMLGMQKDLIDTYDQASRAWFSRVKSEVDHWSELAAKLAGTRSVPEALEAYQKCAAERMQMAAEDGLRMTEDCQRIMQKITGSLSNGWPKASS